MKWLKENIDGIMLMVLFLIILELCREYDIWHHYQITH